MFPGRGVELLLDSVQTKVTWGGDSQVTQAGLELVFFTNGLVLKILILTTYLKSVISPSIIPAQNQSLSEDGLLDGFEIEH